MSRICQITGKKTITGQNVSHAKNRTKRKFKVNIQKYTFTLPNKSKVTLKLSKKGLRVLDLKGLMDVS